MDYNYFRQVQTLQKTIVLQVILHHICIQYVELIDILYEVSLKRFQCSLIMELKQLYRI